MIACFSNTLHVTWRVVIKINSLQEDAFVIEHKIIKCCSNSFAAEITVTELFFIN